MGLTIIRRVERPAMIPIRLQPRGKGQKGRENRTIILPMDPKDPGEVKELLAMVNGQTGRKYTQQEVEAQVEARIKGTNGLPSFLKKAATGKWY